MAKFSRPIRTGARLQWISSGLLVPMPPPSRANSISSTSCPLVLISPLPSNNQSFLLQSRRPFQETNRCRLHFGSSFHLPLFCSPRSSWTGSHFLLLFSFPETKSLWLYFVDTQWGLCSVLWSWGMWKEEAPLNKRIPFLAVGSFVFTLSFRYLFDLFHSFQTLREAKWSWRYVLCYIPITLSSLF